MKRKSPLNKASKVPISKLKRKLLEDVKKLVRESGPCQHGDTTACGGYMQASHILPEGAYKNLFIDPRNIIPQCYKHHIHWFHKNPLIAAAWFQDTFPKQWDYLLSVKKLHLDLTPDKINLLRTAAKKGLSEYADCYEQIRPTP